MTLSNAMQFELALKAPSLKVQGPSGCDDVVERGIAKTRLQHIITATAMNVVRLVNWLQERPKE